MMAITSTGISPPALAGAALPPTGSLTGAGTAESLKGRDAAQVAHEFEAMFVSMMMKEMRQAGSDQGLFPGDSGDTLGGLFDMTLGEHIAAAGGIGISRLLEQSRLLSRSTVGTAGTERGTIPEDATDSVAGRGVYRHAAIRQD